MKQYRIYTEAKQMNTILEETEACFNNFTTYLVEGNYNGFGESSLVIEIITEATEYPLVKTLAESIKLLNKQDSVLLTEQDILTESI